MEAAERALLAACADEVAGVRTGVEAVSALTTRLIVDAAPDVRAEALAEAQVFDLLAQRLEGLGAVLAALAAGEAPQAAVHAVALSEMAARLSGRPRDPGDAAPASGDCLLFG